MSTTFSAEVEFRQEKPREPHRPPLVTAKIPSSVRDYFSAKAGDLLVFVKGSTHAAERAALRGQYLIVTLERAPQPESEKHQEPVPEIVRQDDSSVASLGLLSLEEEVRRRLDGR